MNALKELILAAPALWLAWGGFAIGLVFGLLVHLTRFCAMGALSDMANFGDRRRFRSWLLAVAVAMLGAQVLATIGAVDLSKSMYLAPRLNWAGNFIGGAAFGIGMVFAGGCASRNLVRAGGGDLRALVVLLVMGWSAYLALGGILGPLRAALDSRTAMVLGGLSSQGLDAVAAALSGGDSEHWRWPVTASVGGALLAYCLAARDFRTSPVHLAGGIGVGVCVVAAWTLTGLAYDEFAATPLAPQGLTFVRPTGDTLDYLARWSAAPVPGFAVATVFGTLTGGLFAALATRQFRWAGFADGGDTVRNLAGAVLMGVGGVLALGCTLGQAVTGVSTLALGSFLSFAAIVAGGLLGLRLLESWID